MGHCTARGACGLHQEVVYKEFQKHWTLQIRDGLISSFSVKVLLLRSLFVINDFVETRIQHIGAEDCAAVLYLFVQLIAGSQRVLDGVFMVWSVQVEDVDALSAQPLE